MGCSDKHDVGIMMTVLEIMFQEKRLLAFPVLIAVMGQKYIKSKVTFNRSTLSEMIRKICIVARKCYGKPSQWSWWICVDFKIIIQPAHFGLVLGRSNVSLV